MSASCSARSIDAARARCSSCDRAYSTRNCSNGRSHSSTGSTCRGRCGIGSTRRGGRRSCSVSIASRYSNVRSPVASCATRTRSAISRAARACVACV